MRQHKTTQDEKEVDREITPRQEVAQRATGHVVEDHGERRDTPQAIEHDKALRIARDMRTCAGLMPADG